MDRGDRRTDLTSDFVAYTRGLSAAEIVRMFEPVTAAAGYKAPSAPGTYYYGYVFQRGDMPIMLSRFVPPWIAATLRGVSR